MRLLLNITAPHLPRTSDGKAPDLGALRDPIGQTVARVLDAVERQSRAGRRTPTTKTFAAVRAHLDASIAAVSGNGSRRYTKRQLYYHLRGVLLQTGECAGELKFDTYSKIIDQIESELGHDLTGMTRDPRGFVHHPHHRLITPLGTVAVEQYARPEWRFRNVVYIEKEGFLDLLQEAGFPERWDCAIMSAKGQSTRAAKDFIDQLAGGSEPVTVFAVHDADAAGTVIYQSLQEEAIARPRRRIEIVNLGLEPWEGRALGLLPEPVEPLDRRRPVADYVLAHEAEDEDDVAGEMWADWLQHYRYELDAIDPDEFPTWLDGKMEAHGATKAIPDAATLEEKVRDRFGEMVADVVRDELVERFQIEGFVARIGAAEAIQTIADAVVDHFTPGSLADEFELDPQQPWDDVQQAYLDEVIEDERETLLAAVDAVIVAERETLPAALDAVITEADDGEIAPPEATPEPD